MSICKEKNGTWTVEYYVKDYDGHRHHTSKRGFKTKKEAKIFEANKSATPNCNMYFEQFVERYVEDKKNELKARTLIMKADITNRHILPYFGDKRLSDIKSADIIQWKNHILDQGFSPAYVRTIDNQFGAYFTHASLHYGLRENPCKKVKKMGTFNRRLEYLTFDEYKKFIAMYPQGSRNHAIFQTLAFTGMRCGELLALTKEDIDLESRKISINKTFYRKNQIDYITPPKTAESVRTISIPVFLAEELRAYMDSIPDLKDDERIFPVVAETIQHSMKNMLAKAGLKHVPVHGWRHFFASYLISQGVEAIVIKEMLGHKDIKMTLNVYGHLYPNRQEEVTELLDRVINME